MKGIWLLGGRQITRHKKWPRIGNSRRQCKKILLGYEEKKHYLRLEKGHQAGTTEKIPFRNIQNREHHFYIRSIKRQVASHFHLVSSEVGWLVNLWPVVVMLIFVDLGW